MTCIPNQDNAVEEVTCIPNQDNGVDEVTCIPNQDNGVEEVTCIPTDCCYSELAIWKFFSVNGHHHHIEM